MSEKQLRELIEFASKQCDRLFAKRGAIHPLWHAVKSNGDHIPIACPLEDKDLSVAMVRALFDLEDVVRYVFIDEAWTLERLIDDADMDRINREGLSKHPERVEVVILSGEDSEYGQIMMQRKIIRPANGKPYLAPMESWQNLPYVPQGATAQSEGRMVGMLPVRGVRH